MVIEIKMAKCVHEPIITSNHCWIEYGGFPTTWTPGDAPNHLSCWTQTWLQPLSATAACLAWHVDLLGWSPVFSWILRRMIECVWIQDFLSGCMEELAVSFSFLNNLIYLSVIFNLHYDRFERSETTINLLACCWSKPDIHWWAHIYCKPLLPAN